MTDHPERLTVAERGDLASVLLSAVGDSKAFELSRALMPIIERIALARVEAAPPERPVSVTCPKCGTECIDLMAALANSLAAKAAPPEPTDAELDDALRRFQAMPGAVPGAGEREAPTPEQLRKMADWFGDATRSPYIVCPGFMGEARPSAMLRQIANELELKRAALAPTGPKEGT